MGRIGTVWELLEIKREDNRKRRELKYKNSVY